MTAFRLTVEGPSKWAPDDGFSDMGLVNDFTREAQPAAARIASQFLDIARLKGQYWLGLTGGPGEPIDLVRVETLDGMRLPVEVKPLEHDARRRRRPLSAPR